MFKRNHIFKALVVATVAASSNFVLAQETEDGNASITVANAFVLTETTPLDLGTFLVTHDSPSGGACTVAASIILQGDGDYGTNTAGTCPGSAQSSFGEIAAGTPGVFTITGAAPNTPMQLDLPNSGASGTATNLTNFGNASAIFELTLDEQVADMVYVVGGPADGSPYNDTSSNLVTDGTGSVGFAYGGSIATVVGFAGPYPDGVYSGTYSVTVSY